MSYLIFLILCIKIDPFSEIVPHIAKVLLHMYSLCKPNIWDMTGALYTNPRYITTVPRLCMLH